MNPESPDQAANAAPIDDRPESDGYVPPAFILYPDDVLRAWSVARISRLERILIQYVCERTWGENGPSETGDPPCRIDLDRLAVILGVPRRNFTRALKWLIRDNMILEVPDGYRVGYDVDRWGDGRITPDRKRYAAQGYIGRGIPDEEVADGDD